MKAFLMTYSDNGDGKMTPSYGWHNVETKKKNALRTDGTILIEGNRYPQYQILKVIGDVRGKSVFCNNCKTPVLTENLEEHYAEMEEKADCINCEYLRKDSEEVYKKKIMKKLDDGTYEVRETHKFRPLCSVPYYSVMPREDAIAQRKCAYYLCRQSGTTQYDRESIILMRMPEFFKFVATEKMLVTNGWVLKEIENNYRNYKHPTYRITARVNAMGVVEYFGIYKRPASEEVKFVYSYRYKRLCSINGFDFEKPYWVTDEKMSAYVAQIRRLFE